MSYVVMGWAAGMALAIVVVLLVPDISTPAATLLGFGMTMVGILLGYLVKEARA